MSGSSEMLHSTEIPFETLSEVVRNYGTPTYAFDLGRLRAQVNKLRSHLPSSVQVFYSLKANASLGICEMFERCGLGADVASAGELATAVAAGFSANRMFVAGPYKSSETVEQLRSLPEAIVSVDSLSEFQWLHSCGLTNPVVLRLRPDFGSCAVVQAGSDSRFGFTDEQLRACGDRMPDCHLDVIGFHVFAGSQVLKAENVCEHLRRALDLSLRASDVLRIRPRFIDLGGGFGIPYGPQDQELSLAQVGEAISALVERAAPAQLALELGRYLVAEAGWYLTSVLGHQTFQGRSAVIVDGGTHQRADMCGLCLRTKAYSPIVLNEINGPTAPTDVWGCLSLPADVMAEARSLPKLSRGDVLAFGNAGAYGVWSSPAMFHGSPLPAEVAFDGSRIHRLRDRKPAGSILDDQMHLAVDRIGALVK